MTSLYASFLYKNEFCLLFIFVFLTPLYIYIHCDALLLIILEYCLAVLRCFLFLFYFFIDQCNFTSCLILFSFLINVGYPVHRSAIICLVKLHFFLVDLCLACYINFFCFVFFVVAVVPSTFVSVLPSDLFPPKCVFMA